MKLYRELFSVVATEFNSSIATTSGPFAGRETADQAALILLKKSETRTVVVSMTEKESLLNDDSSDRP